MSETLPSGIGISTILDAQALNVRLWGGKQKQGWQIFMIHAGEYNSPMADVKNIQYTFDGLEIRRSETNRIVMSSVAITNPRIQIWLSTVIPKLEWTKYYTWWLVRLLFLTPYDGSGNGRFTDPWMGLILIVFMQVNIPFPWIYWYTN